MNSDFSQLGKFLMIGAGLLFVVGLILYFSPKIPWLGRLPGDISIKRENFSFHFPIVTSIVISIVLTLLLYLFRR
ncbi:MAG: DUF2905 domain-containing protein [Cyclobacteriaceae bacterium]|nr:DUF2905 domain-containing protein [Cyclobacteriaceae bacterium]MCH8514780.1 DUF2905 domain-containing protein [Cyclobacteriaceae bacterium]